MVADVYNQTVLARSPAPASRLNLYGFSIDVSALRPLAPKPVRLNIDDSIASHACSGCLIWSFSTVNLGVCIMSIRAIRFRYNHFPNSKHIGANPCEITPAL